MNDLNFRTLRADEIECRPAQVTAKGLSLLLYKDARCDMNILDETVGPLRWQRSQRMVGDNLYCTVAIALEPDEDGYREWVTKEDVGTESNMEAEKGQASDAFKRACFNWGIGRELYTAPFIWIPANKCTIDAGKNGNKICKDSFSVEQIEYENRKISFLTIRNDKRREVVWSLGDPAEQPTAEETEVTADMIESMRSEMKRVGKPERGVLDWLGVAAIEDLTIDKYRMAMDAMAKVKK